MYVITFVQDDVFRRIETVSKDKANQEFIELRFDPSVTELEAYVLTIDVKFSSNSKSYTYFLDTPLKGYRFVKLPSGDIVQIIGTKLRKVEELKALAKRQGFSFADYKVLHGTAIK